MSAQDSGSESLPIELFATYSLPFVVLRLTLKVPLKMRWSESSSIVLYVLSFLTELVLGLIKSKVSCKAEINKSFAVNACCEDPHLSEIFRDCLSLV